MTWFHVKLQETPMCVFFYFFFFIQGNPTLPVQPNLEAKAVLGYYEIISLLSEFKRRWLYDSLSFG